MPVVRCSSRDTSSPAPNYFRRRAAANPAQRRVALRIITRVKLYEISVGRGRWAFRRNSNFSKRGRGRDERIIFRLTIVQRLIKGITFLMSRRLGDYVHFSRDCVPSLVSGFYLVRNCAPHLKFERILLSRESEREREREKQCWNIDFLSVVASH